MRLVSPLQKWILGQRRLKQDMNWRTRILVLPVAAAMLGFMAAWLPNGMFRDFPGSLLGAIRGDGNSSIPRTVPARLCPHCKAPVQPLVLRQPSRVTCGLCRKITDAYMLSDAGTLERPSWFLQGYLPAGTARLTRNKTAEESLVSVWFTLFRQIAYRRDPGNIWQRPAFTWRMKAGDCEDHALLLTDTLRSLGYDARTVYGKWKGSGHAWAVVNFKGKEYLLEQVANKPARFPPRASLLLAEYHPGAAFDDASLYLPTKAGSVPSGYWDAGQWNRIPITNP